MLADLQNPLAHKTSHEKAGSDELVIDWTQIINEPSTYPPEAHKTSHQKAGSDEISVVGLSGLLADPQTPLGHSDLRVIAEVTLEAVATTITFTGLDINTHKYYLLAGTCENIDGVGQWVRMFVNGDFTASRYWYQSLYVWSTTIQAGRVNAPNLIYMGAGEESVFWGILARDPESKARTVLINHCGGALNPQFMHIGHVYTQNVTNITRLDFSFTAANKLEAGSRIIIFGVVE